MRQKAQFNQDFIKDNDFRKHNNEIDIPNGSIQDYIQQIYYYYVRALYKIKQLSQKIW